MNGSGDQKDDEGEISVLDQKDHDELVYKEK